jgi:hypothetical protein
MPGGEDGGREGESDDQDRGAGDDLDALTDSPGQERAGDGVGDQTHA